MSKTNVDLICGVLAFAGGLLLMMTHHSGIADSELHGFLDMMGIGLMAVPVWRSI